ncbi:MAG TPA: 16S rRNA (cytidine(1402)-2'-O)-methyltransferase [Victivallales bacterium]|nr:16S rRNA (cytidine(1402)-2'-O)-methyltransferase [Victivallales bacterium]
MDNHNKSKDVIGSLYIVTTPIGNLEDITYRAVRVLSEVDVIAAEDTRKARILLDRYDIKDKRIISHHVQNEHRTYNYLVNEVLSGKKLAVISEAGSPCISDPGFLVIREAVKNGIKPEIIPGVSAVIFAAMVSALPVEKFVFYGFLPPKKGARGRMLEEIKNSDKTAFIYESPKRVKRLLEEIKEIIGDDCNVALVREATKLHEETIRGTVTEILEDMGEKNPKGEFVVAISSRKSKEPRN